MATHDEPVVRKQWKIPVLATDLQKLMHLVTNKWQEGHRVWLDSSQMQVIWSILSYVNPYNDHVKQNIFVGTVSCLVKSSLILRDFMPSSEERLAGEEPVLKYLDVEATFALKQIFSRMVIGEEGVGIVVEEDTRTLATHAATGLLVDTSKQPWKSFKWIDFREMLELRILPGCKESRKDIPVYDFQTLEPFCRMKAEEYLDKENWVKNDRTFKMMIDSHSIDETLYLAFSDYKQERKGDGPVVRWFSYAEQLLVHFTNHRFQAEAQLEGFRAQWEYARAQLIDQHGKEIDRWKEEKARLRQNHDRDLRAWQEQKSQMVTPWEKKDGENRHAYNKLKRDSREQLTTEKEDLQRASNRINQIEAASRQNEAKHNDDLKAAQNEGTEWRNKYDTLVFDTEADVEALKELREEQTDMAEREAKFADMESENRRLRAADNNSKLQHSRMQKIISESTEKQKAAEEALGEAQTRVRALEQELTTAQNDGRTDKTKEGEDIILKSKIELDHIVTVLPGGTVDSIDGEELENLPLARGDLEEHAAQSLKSRQTQDGHRVRDRDCEVGASRSLSSKLQRVEDEVKLKVDSSSKNKNDKSKQRSKVKAGAAIVEKGSGEGIGAHPAPTAANPDAEVGTSQTSEELQAVLIQQLLARQEETRIGRGSDESKMRSCSSR